MTPTVAEGVDEDGCQRAAQVVGPEAGPVANAVVTELSGGRSATTSQHGKVCLDPLLDDLEEIARLLVIAEGFAVVEQTVSLDGAGDVEIALRPAFGEEMVVTSSRSAERLVDVAVPIEVIDRQDIERVVARTLAEVVEWSPGIRVESTCQNCNQPTVRMLGLEGPYTQMLIDGQPTVSSLALVYGLEQLPARWIDSVEVVKGGGSALYGAGAVAGVINLVPHQATHPHTVLEGRGGTVGGEPSTSLSALVDWASTDRTTLFTGFVQKDRVDPSDRDGDGFTEVTRRRLETVGLRGDRYLRDGEIRLTAELNASQEERRGGNRLDLPPDQADIAESIDSDRWGLTLGFLQAPGPRFDWRLVASLSRTDRDSYYGTGRDPLAYGTTENPLWVVDAQLNHHRKRGSIAWGAQVSRDELDDIQLGYDRRLEEVFEQEGLFAQHDFKLAKGLSVLYGLRLDRHSAVDSTIASPRVAVLYAPRANLSLRASVARGFRPPAVFDEDLHIELVGGGDARVVRNAPGLRHETSTNSLVSLEWRPTFKRKGSASLSLDLFSTELDDLFDTQETDDPSTAAVEVTRVNFGRATVRGVELAASLRWGSRWSLNFGWVSQRARFDQPEPDFGSLDFHRTPENHGLATVTVRLPREVDLFVGLSYTGSMLVPHFAGFIAEDRLERTPSFLTADLNLAREFELDDHRRLTVTVGAKNLTDEFQEDLDRGILRDSAYVYGPRFPRSWIVSLRLEL